MCFCELKTAIMNGTILVVNGKGEKKFFPDKTYVRFVVSPRFVPSDPRETWGVVWARLGSLQEFNGRYKRVVEVIVPQPPDVFFEGCYEDIKKLTDFKNIDFNNLKRKFAYAC
ncbi:MAG: hypothetical protein V1851_01955 [Patescibacteria group bacterium]